MKMKVITGFTQPGFERFVKFLQVAYGEEYYNKRVSVRACIDHFIKVAEEQLNNGETMRWEISQFETPLKHPALFYADESDVGIEEIEVV